MTAATAATLAAASGTALALAALRYQHVIDGQDADIVAYLERFGNEPPQPRSRPGGPESLGNAGSTDRAKWVY